MEAPDYRSRPNLASRNRPKPGACLSSSDGLTSMRFVPCHPSSRCPASPSPTATSVQRGCHAGDRSGRDLRLAGAQWRGQDDDDLDGLRSSPARRRNGDRAGRGFLVESVQGQTGAGRCSAGNRALRGTERSREPRVLGASGGVGWPGRPRARAGELLSALQLTDRAGDAVKKYSGGMKRRINLGAALMHRPRLLLLDEPTVGIDPQARASVLEFIRGLGAEGTGDSVHDSLSRGGGVVLSPHRNHRPRPVAGGKERSPNFSTDWVGRPLVCHGRRLRRGGIVVVAWIPGEVPRDPTDRTSVGGGGHGAQVSRRTVCGNCSCCRCGWRT